MENYYKNFPLHHRKLNFLCKLLEYKLLTIYDVRCNIEFEL